MTLKGKVPDAPDLTILECTDCGLVTLCCLKHIKTGFYQYSGMHGTTVTPIDVWLKDKDWDDQRRFNSLKSFLPNRKVLDFGCGAGGFLSKCRNLATSVSGIELELRMQKHWQDLIDIHPTT